MDPEVHKRFLDYRDRHAYFAKPGQKKLTMEEFSAADAEHETLESKNDRDDEDEARYVELTKLLFRD